MCDLGLDIGDVAQRHGARDRAGDRGARKNCDMARRRHMLVSMHGQGEARAEADDEAEELRRGDEAVERAVRQEHDSADPDSLHRDEGDHDLLWCVRI